ncbi:MAG: hypothetical protein ACR2F1_14300 [Nitrososphaeraceae archaeon]
MFRRNVPSFLLSILLFVNIDISSYNYIVEGKEDRNDENNNDDDNDNVSENEKEDYDDNFDDTSLNELFDNNNDDDNKDSNNNENLRENEKEDYDDVPFILPFIPVLFP